MPARRRQIYSLARVRNGLCTRKTLKAIAITERDGHPVHEAVIEIVCRVRLRSDPEAEHLADEVVLHGALEGERLFVSRPSDLHMPRTDMMDRVHTTRFLVDRREF